MRLIAAASLLVALTAPALAAPPEGSLPLSEILAEIEQRPDFAYFDEIEMDDGYWEIEYYTQEGARVEIDIDPVSGQPR